MAQGSRQRPQTPTDTTTAEMFRLFLRLKSLGLTPDTNLTLKNLAPINPRAMGLAWPNTKQIAVDLPRLKALAASPNVQRRSGQDLVAHEVAHQVAFRPQPVALPPVRGVYRPEYQRAAYPGHDARFHEIMDQLRQTVGLPPSILATRMGQVRAATPERRLGPALRRSEAVPPLNLVRPTPRPPSKSPKKSRRPGSQ